MNRFIKFIKNNPKTIGTLVFLGFAVLVMLNLEMDNKAIAIITLVLGYITNAFVGLGALISMVPIIGPLVIKVLSIPFFWLLNAAGYFTSAYAIKKGYGKDVVTHRLVVVVLLVGIVIGYILGNLIPLH